ncbi:MAG: DCL family protein [Caldilineaceae bacterium]
MGKRQAFIINGEKFATKKDLLTRVRQILHSYKDGQTLNMFDLAFIGDLLNNHPQAEQKIGCGISSIFVKQNPVFHGNRGFWIRREDGTQTDFSFMECLSPSSQKKKVLSAFRAAVEPFTFAFKQQFFDSLADGIATCDYTGQVLTFVGSHVDHKPPNTFEKIFSDFIDNEDLDIAKIELLGGAQDNLIQDEIADPTIKDRWITFHNQQAELRVVSSKANLSDVKLEQ